VVSAPFRVIPIQRNGASSTKRADLLELAAGLTCAVAIYFVFKPGAHWIPVAAIGLAGLNLLCLFTGQRLAKDYAGAVSIASYFAVCLVMLYLFSVGFEIGLQ